MMGSISPLFARLLGELLQKAVAGLFALLVLRKFPFFVAAVVHAVEGAVADGFQNIHPLDPLFADQENAVAALLLKHGCQQIALIRLFFSGVLHMHQHGLHHPLERQGLDRFGHDPGGHGLHLFFQKAVQLQFQGIKIRAAGPEDFVGHRVKQGGVDQVFEGDVLVMAFFHLTDRIH